MRDRKPVFCEKTTELVDGVYVTTRGCSTKQWEDVDLYMDHRNQDLRCFRRNSIEQCLCARHNCNAAHSNAIASFTLLITAFVIIFSL